MRSGGAMLPLLMVALWIVLMVGVVTASWIRPDVSLRIASTSCVIAWLLTVLAENIFPHWQGLHGGVLLIDVLYAGLLGWITINTRAAWAILATGFQASSIAVHLSFLLTPRVHARAYYTALVITSFFMALSILGGAVGALYEQSAGRMDDR